ncbi:eCIS core domain-containing protein [Nostoc sp.]|uniref:eCIS core domain-containing protein n=1 Tax=Nostoc sp. TaxID=1180 RepID=UPI002FF8FCDD
MKSLKSPSSSFSNFQAPEQTPQLAYRPFGGQTQKASFTPVTQTDVENEAFVEEKMEVTGLELQAKHRTITPEGQERLTVLQAKMDRSLNSRLEKATRFGHNFANISVRRPDTSTSIQAKLTIGEPGDKYEQEADQTAHQVMQRIHQPENGKLQREELPDEEELQAKPEGSIQREELLEEEVQMKSWGETPSLQREELPEEELQMKSLGTSSQIVNEVQSPTKPLGHDISRISLRRPQTKLTVNQPGDIYEQEADSVAQLVMQRMSEPVQSIQREALPEEEDQLQMKSLADSVTPLVQRQGGGRTAATSELETSIQQARGNGQPLADDIKHPMEQAFGADFGSVRVHTDAQSNRLNESIQARAFTTGQDVFFRQGEYSPGSNAGKELLAHELTHVVQQNGSAVQPKSLHVAPKENKLQTKVPTTSAGHGLAIQLRENFQKPSDEDNQKNLESKTDTENGEQQNQAKTEKHQASPTPPDDGGNAATDPPPTKKVGAAVTQKQVEAGGNQAKEPESKDTKVNTEKVDSQQQAQSKGADVGKGTADLPGGNAGKAIAGLPGANVASTTVKLPDAAVDGKKAPTSPEDDPAFQAVAGTTKEVAGLEKKHPPANSKAQEAQAAAQPPGNEVDSKAQANQVGEMQQAPTPGFDAAAFKAKLMERIADMAPKNLEEADNFKNNNKLDSVKGDLSGQVKEEQKSSQGQLEEKTKEKPDASGIEAKQVTPLPKNEPGTTPTGVDADKAAPKSKGQGEVEAPLQDDSKKLDQQMKEADVTEEQLANSNEPEFQGALAAKKDAQTNAVEAPPQYRQQEQGILATAQATAEATAQQHLQAMHGIRTQNLGQVGEQQIGAKSKDEQARAKVAGDINKIYDKTKGKVEKTLSELDGQVIQAFDAGAADAKKAFEDYVGKRMDDYKSDRYSGFWGPGKWLIDKLFGMPSEVNAFYQEGRQLYINQMDGVINKVVAIISKGLTQAKAEIANGKQEIQNYVNQLPQDLKGVGQQAAADIDSKFEELQQSVDDKQDELIDTLAQKYQENLEAVDARIEEMKAANKGFIQKAFDFIVGVIKTIIELTKMLLQVLARVAGVVGQILKDPIGFLTNLIQALKQGFLNFMNNIGKHLQQGLIGWLTGTMAETGIQMPENFDLKGIFSLAMQLVGFTYEAIRAQAVKRLGEEKVSRLEQTVDVFQVLASEGVAGMWQFVQEKMGDLNALVIEPIKNFIIEKVITAGIEWILSLLTPASAFIKAAKAIYEIVKFFIERAQQIADLINAILDAIGAIASGAIDQAIKGVENALAKSLPVVISFLASLLGLDGIAGKIQAIFQKLRKPMEKAVDWVIDKGAKAFKKVGNKIKNSKFGKKAGELKDKAKEKYKAGKQWVEDKKEASQQWVNDKKAAAEQWVEDKKEGVSNKFKNSKFGKKVGAVTESAKEKYKASKQWIEDKKEASQQWVNDKKAAAQNWIEDKKGAVKDRFKQSKLGQKLGEKRDTAKEQGSKKNEVKNKDEKKKTDQNEKSKAGLKDGQIGPTIHFDAPDEKHELWVVLKGSSVNVMMASGRKELLRSKLDNIQKQIKADNPQNNNAVATRANKLIDEIKGLENELRRFAPKRKRDQELSDSETQKMRAGIQKFEQQIAAKVEELFNLDVITAQHISPVTLEERFALFAKDSPFAPVDMTANPRFKNEQGYNYKWVSSQPFRHQEFFGFFKDKRDSEGFSLSFKNSDNASYALSNLIKKEKIAYLAEAPKSYVIIGEKDKEHYVSEVSDTQANQGADQDLKNAVQIAGGVKQFMKQIANGDTVNGINLDKLNTICNSNPKNVTYLGSEVRQNARHEWIPCNYSLDVIKRAKEKKDLVWIDLQDELRSNTKDIIFKPNKAEKDTTISPTGKKVMQGHSGALYGQRVTGGVIPLIKNQPEFHDDLRKAFDKSKTIQECNNNLESVFDSWVWNGVTVPDKSEYHNEYYRSPQGGKKYQLSDMNTEAAQGYQNIQNDFKKMKNDPKYQ